MSIDSDIKLEMTMIDIMQFDGIIPFNGPSRAQQICDLRREAFERANADHPMIEFMTCTDDPSCYMMGEFPDSERVSWILSDARPRSGIRDVMKKVLK